MLLFCFIFIIIIVLFVYIKIYKNMSFSCLMLLMQIKLLKSMKKGKVVLKTNSRGVAFVEFTEHQHALVALRVLNNNPGNVFHFHSSSCYSYKYDDRQQLCF